MSESNENQKVGNTCLCPACPIPGVGHAVQSLYRFETGGRADINPETPVDKPTGVEGLRATISRVSIFVLRVHPLASLMRSARTHTCKRIGVGGRTRRTKKLSPIFGGYSVSAAAGLSIGETPGGRTRRTKQVLS